MWDNSLGDGKTSLLIITAILDLPRIETSRPSFGSKLLFVMMMMMMMMKKKKKKKKKKIDSTSKGDIQPTPSTMLPRPISETAPNSTDPSPGEVKVAGGLEGVMSHALDHLEDS